MRPPRGLRLGPLVGALLLLCAPTQAEPATRAPSVILLSWDGVRHDYPARVDLPALERMAREGARAQRLIPVFPTDTFPNHVSLATGSHPDRHGIVGNVFWDRERGLFHYGEAANWMLAEPLWVTAERQGVAAATFFWVGAETAWRGQAARFRRAPFDADVPESEKVDQIVAWLDLPPASRPRLIMSWWHGADRAGHRHGPDADDIGEALVDQDRELARLLEALDARDLWRELTLIVVSDHGMAYATEEIDLEAALLRLGVAGRIVVGGNAIAHVFLDDVTGATEAARRLDGLPGIEAYASHALPETLRLGPERRLGHVVCIASPPHTFRGGALRRALRWLGRNVGGHGYRPQRSEDVHAVLFAMGRSVPAGAALGRVRNIDIAPTVARLLGIEAPAQSEGMAIDFGALPVAGAR